MATLIVPYTKHIGADFNYQCKKLVLLVRVEQYELSLEFMIHYIKIMLHNNNL